MEESDINFTDSFDIGHEIRLAAHEAQVAFLIDQIIAAHPSQTCLELSGLKRRCGLTTSILRAVAKLVQQNPSISILVVCSGQAPAAKAKKELKQIDKKAAAVVEILSASFVEKQWTPAEWNKQFDVVIVDDFKFIYFAKKLQSSAKTLVLCQTGMPPTD